MLSTTANHSVIIKHNPNPLAIESAALAEKLLNDLLKTTEGFQKLKKINEELKQQCQSDFTYVSKLSSLPPLKQEPVKKENERIVRENNELHLLLIKVKEEGEVREM
jgi:centrosomal protein CEP135